MNDLLEQLEKLGLTRQQREMVLLLLKYPLGYKIPLPEFLNLRQACFKVRMKELRAKLATLGYGIRNHMETIGGVRNSWYSLHELESVAQEQVLVRPAPRTEGLFQAEELRPATHFGYRDYGR